MTRCPVITGLGIVAAPGHGVAEVWRYDGDRLEILVLEGDVYAAAPQSHIFPVVTAAALTATEVIVVSEQDRSFLRSDRVTVVENGVDTEAFTPGSKARTEPTIVFTGNMGYGPNVDAAVWFATSCFPRIRGVLRDVRFMVAGDRPSSRVRALGLRHGVTVTGRVPSIADVLRDADVAVVPLLSGSGIQNKVLEAMACGVPVVTTRIGLGGLRALPNVHLLVEDDANAFADAVVALLESPARSDELGRAGRAFVVAEHSWQRAADQVDAIYRRAVQAARLR